MERAGVTTNGQAATGCAESAALYGHRPADDGCSVCVRDAYRLAEIPLGSHTVAVPLCADCFLVFSSFPREFTLARVVGLDRDRRRLPPVPRGSAAD